MSTVQQAKPRFANQSITDESGRPGTVRSNVGVDAIDEPCTNRTQGLPSGLPTYFSHRKSLTSPLWVQCSTPATPVVAGASEVGVRLIACSVVQSIFAPVSVITRAQRSRSAR